MISVPAATAEKTSVAGAPRLSLIVSTLARVSELTNLLTSLEAQDFRDFELIVVDQNDDDRLAQTLAEGRWSFRVRHLHTPGERGISRGKNRGWRASEAEVVLFPDDDCWYPPHFLSYGMEVMDATEAEFVSGRSVDETMRSINARFSTRARRINRSNVWTCQMEWATFVRRSALERLDGFREDLGVGGPTRWQAAEGPDLLLRAVESGMVCLFDPTLFGYHGEFELNDPSGQMARKGRAYARGMGYVLAAHGYSGWAIVYWAARPAVRFLVTASLLRGWRARYFGSVMLGRLEGWRDGRRVSARA